MGLDKPRLGQFDNLGLGRTGAALRFCLLACQWIGRRDSRRRFRVTGENEVLPHPLLDDIHAASAKPANIKAVHRGCGRRFDDDNFHSLTPQTDRLSTLSIGCQPQQNLNKNEPASGGRDRVRGEVGLEISRELTPRKHSR
jgi:hypothetical protein